MQFHPQTSAALAISNIADQREAEWREYRRELHRHPEPSGEEFQTTAGLAQSLQELGIACEIPARGVGVVGDMKLGGAADDSPMIALRADIDALRMPDRKQGSLVSQREGLAHACGHDVHTTIVLAAAEMLTALCQSEDPRATTKLPPVRIRLIFQAAEESGEGAQWMVDDGYLEPVDSILGLHVEPNLLAGQIGIRYGVLTAAVDAVRMEVKGNGGHTARPHHTTDPIQAAAMLVSNLYQSLPRRVDVRDPSVFTLGQIHGGLAANVIPDVVRLAGTLRCTDEDSREELQKQIRTIAEHVGAMTGNDVEVDFHHSLGSVINSDRETQCYEEAGREIVGDDALVMIDQPSMGGEDFGAYLQECDGSQIRLGCASRLPWPHLHSPIFDVDESAIRIGASVMTRAAILLGQTLLTTNGE